MYYIDFQNNKFNISIRLDECLDPDDYQNFIDYLKTKELYFDYDNKYFKLPTNRVDAIIEWFIRDNKKYSLSLEAIEEIEKLQNILYKSDLKIFRNRSYIEEEFKTHILKDSVNLFEFQKEDVSWRLKRNNYLDANDAGLGKTITSISVFSYLYYKKYIDSVFIVVPIGLSYHWKYEILEYSKIFKEEDIHIICNDNKNQPFKTIQDKKIVIVPAYLLPDVVISYNKTKRKTRSKKLVRWDNVVSKNFDLKKLWNKENIFYCHDEFHEIKNSKAVRTKCIHSLRDSFSYRVGLTATPNIVKFEDIYSQISFINKSIIPMSFEAFQLWISTGIDNRRGLQIVEYDEKKTKYVLDKMKTVFTKRLKEDVPEMKFKRHFRNFYLELTPLQKKIYQMVTEEELKHLQEEYDKITWKLFFDHYHLIIEVFENPLLLKKRYYNNTELNKLLNKYKIEDDPKFIFLQSRLEYLIEYKNNKVVVYDHRPDTLNLLYEKFKKYNPLIIHGKLRIKDKEKDRKEKEYQFNTNDYNKLILLSSNTSSQGINLNKKSNTIIYYNVPADTTDFRQGIDRTHRINSTRDSFIWLPYYPNTLERIKVERTMNRVEFNDKLGKEISQEDLENLLNGKI